MGNPVIPVGFFCFCRLATGGAEQGPLFQVANRGSGGGEDGGQVVDHPLLVFRHRGAAINVNQVFFTPPEAVASVIPGPSELPYLYNNGQVLASSTGSQFVAKGNRVYLRGFAIDQDLASPQQFNPDVPCFDIYENKNGNFSASTFSYFWTLKDKSGADVSSLLQPSPAEENVFFTVPGNAQAGDHLIASLTVTDDLGNASNPQEVAIFVSEAVDDRTCFDCHSANAALLAGLMN